MANEFQSPLDIANRALQHLGAKRISPTLGFAEVSKQAAEMSFAYDKLRVAELRRNTWRFATKRAPIRPVNSIAIRSAPFSVEPTVSGTPLSPTMLIAPAMWSAASTYTVGALVTDVSGYIWQSQQPSNTNNTPGQSAAWEQYFGPMTVDNYDPTQAYFAGDLAYTFTGTGVNPVYQSMMSGNVQPPTIPVPWSASQVYAQDEVVIVYPAWSSSTTYSQGATVVDGGGFTYSSLINSNLNNTPSTSPTAWQIFPTSTVTADGQLVSGIPEFSLGSESGYVQGDFFDWGGIQYLVVTTSPLAWVPLTGGTLYQSAIDLNYNNAPPASEWTTSITSGAGSLQWKTLNVALQQLGLVYPLGSGPTWQAETRNAYRLPAGFLKTCNQDPKAGSVSIIGSPTGSPYTDWEYEGDYLVTREAFPIVFRFIANVTQVPKMDPMFCEGLAARLAYELCEPITQSMSKRAEAAQAYTKFMSEARLVNAVDVGAEEPAVDDYIACRV